MLGCPSAPPASVVPPQEKFATASVVPMLFPAVPAVLAVTVTKAPLDVAVTPETFRVIASRRLLASVVVSADVAKLVPVLVPSVPPLRAEAAQEKPDNVSPRGMLLPAVPLILAVTVVVAVLPVAGTPNDVEQAVIAAARIDAKVVVELLVANVAVAKVGQAFEPSAPPLTDPHEKTLLVFAVDRVGAVPGVKSVTIVWFVLPPVPWAAVALTAENEL